MNSAVTKTNAVAITVCPNNTTNSEWKYIVITVSSNFAMVMPYTTSAMLLPTSIVPINTEGSFKINENIFPERNLGKYISI